LSVPAQDRRRCDQQSESATSGQQSGEGCDQGSVGPADLWPWCSSLQHRQLMAQDEDLDVFRGVGPGVQHHPGHEFREHLIDQLQRHWWIMPQLLRSQIASSAAGREVSGTHKVNRSATSRIIMPWVGSKRIRSSRP